MRTGGATGGIHPRISNGLGLNAGDTCDAEAVNMAKKDAYQAQATVTRAIIVALNIAVPKAFKRGTTAVGGAMIGVAAYRSNHNLRAILLALRTTYDIPSPAECNANNAAFRPPGTPRSPSKFNSTALKIATWRPSLPRHPSPWSK